MRTRLTAVERKTHLKSSQHLYPPPFPLFIMFSNISSAFASICGCFQVCKCARGKKTQTVWSCIKASESELWNWPTQREKRKTGGLPDESLKSESEPCRAPATSVCVRQCVFHRRWLLKLCWVHEFQAVGLLFFSPLRGKQNWYTCTFGMLPAFCSGSEVYFWEFFQSSVCSHWS